MNNLAEKRFFSFVDGLLSFFWGTRQSRLIHYYDQNKNKTDFDNLKSDFLNIGSDLKKVMESQAKIHSLEF